MKSIFEELGGTYTLGEDGMYYPNLELPVEEEPHYGKYGRMRMNYIKEHRPGLYTDGAADSTNAGAAWCKRGIKSS